MGFRFKKFEIEDDRSTMKVGTDAVLLGSWVDIGGVLTALDIGTGCGVIALMLAQRSKALVTGIDIDGDSVEQARLNGLRSPWAARLNFVRQSFREHSPAPGNTYDLIVSNPPYFSRSLASPERKRNLSRHQESISFREVFGLSASMLSESGRIGLVFQGAKEEEVFRAAGGAGASLIRALRVFTRKGRPNFLVLAEFGYHNERQEKVEATIHIQDETGGYTGEYIGLTGDFYLNF